MHRFMLSFLCLSGCVLALPGSVAHALDCNQVTESNYTCQYKAECIWLKISYAEATETPSLWTPCLVLTMKPIELSPWQTVSVGTGCPSGSHGSVKQWELDPYVTAASWGSAATFTNWDWWSKRTVRSMTSECY